ncbi:MAG: UDP-N-acetylmuramoyl-L-alanine--D-glutamate ligase, partial [bacterium]|nr:UDP-N-acetylmuramoyl-L-alanine--D-glutamate ligase [bacterium]
MRRLRIAGAKALVVGMGLSGLAAVELLNAKGAEVRATDVKPLDEMPAVAEQLQSWNVTFSVQGPEAFRGRDLVVLSPGVPVDLEVVAQSRIEGARIIGEVE